MPCDALLARPGVPPAPREIPLALRSRIVERARGVPALLVGELQRWSAEIEMHGSLTECERPVAAPVPPPRASAPEPVAWSPPLVRPPPAHAIAPSSRVSELAPEPLPAAERLGAATARAALAARRAARAQGTRALALGVAAAATTLRAFAVLLALLVILGHALRARFLLGADRGNERIAQAIRAAADWLLRVIARVDALSARWDAVGAPAWDQLARDLRDAGERALRFVQVQVLRAARAGRAFGIRALERARIAALETRELAARAAQRARAACAAAYARARLGGSEAIERAREHAHALPAQLAPAIARLPTPRMPALSQQQVLLAASLAALLALLAGGAREESAVASVGPPQAVAAVSAPPPPEPAATAAPQPIRVRVNARPWAFIRVDGVAVGPTPLSHLHLSEGPHEFEAEFADGRRLKQEVVIGPEQRWVSLR
jgi:hypothetical protein